MCLPDLSETISCKVCKWTGSLAECVSRETGSAHDPETSFQCPSCGAPLVLEEPDSLSEEELLELYSSSGECG